MPPFQTIISLVGENPLPIYYGILQFAKPDADVLLLHSPETAELARNICSKIKSDNLLLRHQRSPILLPPLTNAFDPAELTAVLDGLRRTYPEAGLNYTGGTKVMSSAAYHFWQDRPSDAFYLEEANARFHFGDGHTEDQFGFAINIRDLCDLHGVTMDGGICRVALSWEDIEAIWKAYSGERPLPADKLNYWWLLDNRAQWETFLSNLTEATQREWRAVEFPKSATQYRNGQYKAMHELAATKWLERLALHCASLAKPAADSVPAQFFKIKGAQFESDGMLVYNNRLYYFSAGTTKSDEYCKDKMFEASYRARQIGGGLARSAVVCLADKDRYNNDVIDVCRRTINDPKHTIFGKPDVEKWMSGDLQTMREFLER